MIDDSASGCDICVAYQCNNSAACHKCPKPTARKRHFLSHLYIKCIILPRQARDKHRENSKKSGVFSQGPRFACIDQAFKAANGSFVNGAPHAETTRLAAQLD